MVNECFNGLACLRCVGLGLIGASLFACWILNWFIVWRLCCGWCFWFGVHGFGLYSVCLCALGLLLGLLC